MCGERCLKMLPGVFFQTSTVLDDDKNVNTQNRALLKAVPHLELNNGLLRACVSTTRV